jgi:hypothetical protein
LGESAERGATPADTQLPTGALEVLANLAGANAKPRRVVGQTFAGQLDAVILARRRSVRHGNLPATSVGALQG